MNHNNLNDNKIETEEKIWIEKMKQCKHRQIIITYKGDGTPKDYYPAYAQYKGKIAIITGFYGLDRKIYAFVESELKNVKLSLENFYFCDKNGEQIAEPGEFPPDIKYNLTKNIN